MENDFSLSSSLFYHGIKTMFPFFSIKMPKGIPTVNMKIHAKVGNTIIIN